MIKITSRITALHEQIVCSSVKGQLATALGTSPSPWVRLRSQHAPNLQKRRQHAPAAVVTTAVADVCAARAIAPIQDTVVVQRLAAIYHRRLWQGLGVLAVYWRHAHLWGYSPHGSGGSNQIESRLGSKETHSGYSSSLHSSLGYTWAKQT